MIEASGRASELNELTWWSHWAYLGWLDKNTHILTSREFNEPFFNRAGFLECGGVVGSLGAIEMSFRKLGVDSTVLLYDSCASGMKALTSSGYTLFDRMTVMELGRPSFRLNDSLVVLPVRSRTQDSWSRAYLQSFYGDTKLLRSVNKVVARLVRRKDVTLLAGSIGDEMAGVLAIQRSRDFAGVYCVGTLPRFRMMGVSATLICKAYEIASREGRRLVLQTLESDGVEDFYLRRGFRKLYTKNMLSRKLKS